MDQLELIPIDPDSNWLSSWYNHPEKYGLEIIGSIDLAGAYEFSIFVVLKDSSGQYWWAYDAGCSCPTPFENTWTLEGLEDYHSWIEFREIVLKKAGEEDPDDDSDEIYRAAEFLDRLEQVVPGGAWDRLRKLGSEGSS